MGVYSPGVAEITQQLAGSWIEAERVQPRMDVAETARGFFSRAKSGKAGGTTFLAVS